MSRRSIRYQKIYVFRNEKESVEGSPQGEENWGGSNKGSCVRGESSWGASLRCLKEVREVKVRRFQERSQARTVVCVSRSGTQ